MFARDVQVEDQDCYMCQINTERMKKQVSNTRVACHVSRVPRQVGCVTVRVPPDIDESLSSGDVAVAEGANTTLSCVTRGQPQYVARV